MNFVSLSVYVCVMQRRDKGTTFDDSQLVAILFDLLIAGTDTSSNTLRTATLYLMTNPHIQGTYSTIYIYILYFIYFN